MIPRLAFMAQHVGIVGMVATAYPPKYRLPLYAFGAVQGIIEHYADIFPSVAALGPILVPIAIGLLFMHYYFANKVIDNKAIVWGGFAAYFVILVFSKGMDQG